MDKNTNIIKTLVVDRLLKGKPHGDWKEGWAMYYAGIDLGINIDIAGLDCPISECNIPDIAKDYDLIIVSENYPQAVQEDGSTWTWWNRKSITTPKLFWAIDTHVVDYREFIRKSKFDYVGLNNSSDVKKYGKSKLFSRNPEVFHLPLAIRKDIYSQNFCNTKENDVTFIGSLLVRIEKELFKN